MFDRGRRDGLDMNRQSRRAQKKINEARRGLDITTSSSLPPKLKNTVKNDGISATSGGTMQPPQGDNYDNRMSMSISRDIDTKKYKNSHQNKSSEQTKENRKKWRNDIDNNKSDDNIDDQFNLSKNNLFSDFNRLLKFRLTRTTSTPYVDKNGNCGGFPSIDSSTISRSITTNTTAKPNRKPKSGQETPYPKEWSRRDHDNKNSRKKDRKRTKKNWSDRDLVPMSINGNNNDNNNNNNKDNNNKCDDIISIMDCNDESTIVSCLVFNLHTARALAKQEKFERALESYRGIRQLCQKNIDKAKELKLFLLLTEKEIKEVETNRNEFKNVDFNGNPIFMDCLNEEQEEEDAGDEFLLYFDQINNNI